MECVFEVFGKTINAYTHWGWRSTRCGDPALQKTRKHNQIKNVLSRCDYI